MATTIAAPETTAQAYAHGRRLVKNIGRAKGGQKVINAWAFLNWGNVPGLLPLSPRLCVYAYT